MEISLIPPLRGRQVLRGVTHTVKDPNLESKDAYWAGICLKRSELKVWRCSPQISEDISSSHVETKGYSKVSSNCNPETNGAGFFLCRSLCLPSRQPASVLLSNLSVFLTKGSQISVVGMSQHRAVKDISETQLPKSRGEWQGGQLIWLLIRNTDMNLDIWLRFLIPTFCSPVWQGTFNVLRVVSSRKSLYYWSKMTLLALGWNFNSMWTVEHRYTGMWEERKKV